MKIIIPMFLLFTACSTPQPDMARERMIRACMEQLFQREDCERMIAK